MIEIKNVFKAYGEQAALEDISLIIPKGEICMLLGPSGCGKSTLLKIINGMLKADSGQVFINGKEVFEYDESVLRRGIGYAIQGVGLFPHMRVSENIGIVPELLKWNKKKTQSRIEEMLDLVGLEQSFGNKFPRQLSGGEAQRVGVARALAADPDILLMDEPFGALDPLNRFRLQQEFLKIQRKLSKTVVFVTHDIGEAIRMADKLVVMKKGTIAAEGTPISIVDKAEEVAKAFLGNGFTLELLEKFQLSEHEYILEEWNVCEDQMCEEIKLRVEDGLNLKDAVSIMLMQGTDRLVVITANGPKCLSFIGIATYFGGRNL